eukprot:15365262-Ditylum_brightwellii.AAC.1
MGVTVKKLPVVGIFYGWFDECMYFKSDKPPIKISDILDLIYSMLSQRTYTKANKEKAEEFDD